MDQIDNQEDNASDEEVNNVDAEQIDSDLTPAPFFNHNESVKCQ